MSRTPDVVDGAVVQTSWGNEIRDRTIQVFANGTDLATWAAPNGAVAFQLDLYRFKVRSAGIWIPMSACLGSNFAGTTNAQSDITFTHNLGVVPRSVICTADYDTNSNTAMFQVTGKSATAATVRVRNYNGVGQANTVVGFNWIVVA
jgi:hypothetical protein